MYTDLHANFALLLQILMRTLNSGKIFKTKIPNFMIIRPVVDKFLHTDGHTDMTVLTDTFCNFTNGPKMRGNVLPLTITNLFIDMDNTDFTFRT